MKMTLLTLVLFFVLSITYLVRGNNPFFVEYDTPYETPPFDQIRIEHFLPAFEAGIVQHEQEIDAITKNPAEPTFANTIEALDYNGILLTKTSNVFYNMLSALTNDSLQSIAKTIAPKLSKHNDDILLNEKLFQRVKMVYAQKDALNLDNEKRQLLTLIYKDFVRGGANLAEAQKEQLREINTQLSLLAIKFGENVLKEDNRFELIIDIEADLAGLPENVISAAAEAAKERDHAGKWVFTLHKPSLIPFLQYSEKRAYREKMFKAYIHRGDNNDEFDNKQILAKIAALRVKRANLLGYPTHAHFVLEENMAQSPDQVYDLLKQLWTPALNRARQEAKELQTMIDEAGEDFKLAAWDWWYYAEKLKKAKYDLDDESLRPYFKLENVRQGAFDVANKLWGITFEKRTDIPVYHEDVEAFEVKNADGSHIGIYYTDYFPRASKRGGAWMSAYRKQCKINGKMITPIITNVGNFSKPTGDKPSLLSFEEVSTLFHEFGHALHGLLSNCTYPKISGTDVPRDFVELPSQIMENWASEPAVLKMYARHFETGDLIPDELIDKIRNASLFNQGFETTEYLAASFLDMDWHTLKESKEVDVVNFENQSMNQIGLIPEIVVRYRSPYFRHIFSGGYSSGYYSYIWAGVLDADAFEAFNETGLFNRKTAEAFRKNILATGYSDNPMTLYKRFRGSEPAIEPLLKRRGLN